MSTLTTIRRFGLPLLTGASLCAWAVALFLQYGLDMHPCSLCILQRWALTGVLLGSGLAWFLGRRGGRVWPTLVPGLAALAGAVVSGKHLMLQLAPHPAEGGCGFGGEMLLENFPLTEALPALFAGSGDCASLPPVLGAPLPLWTLLFFLGSLAVTAIAVTRDTKSA